MRLIANDEIPIGCRFQLRLQFVGARSHVEPHDETVALDERIARYRGFDLVARQKIELQPEFVGGLLLPLFDEIPRRDHEAPRQIASDQAP